MQKWLARSSALILACIVGCGGSGADEPEPMPVTGPEPITFTKDAVNVDQTFANQVDVLDDRLIIPTRAARSDIKRGTILAGNRSSKGGAKNPYGFLRKVEQVRTEGDRTILLTKRAELADWIENGDLRYDEEESLFEGAGKTTRTRANGGGGSGASSASAPFTADLEGDETTSPNGRARLRPVVRVRNGSIDLNASYDGYFSVRRKWGFPVGVRFRSHLTLDPVFAADIEAGIAVTGEPLGVGTIVGVPLWEKEWSGAGVIVPLPGPIPLTLRFQPQLQCSVRASGQLTATVRARIASHMAIGFEGSLGIGDFTLTDISEAPTFSPSVSFLGAEGKAMMSAECALLLVPMVLAFDAVGLSGSVGPYVSLNANACAKFERADGFDVGFQLYEQHGLAGQFGARVQVPFLGWGKDFNLVSVRTLKSDEAYLVGDKSSCQVSSQDSCEGRADGFYCSEMVPSSGFVCQGGQIALGRQCASNQRCTGGTATRIDCR
jgi:hypothetical protein